MTDPPRIAWDKQSPPDPAGQRVPAGPDAVTGFPFRVAGSRPRHGRHVTAGMNDPSDFGR